MRLQFILDGLVRAEVDMGEKTQRAFTLSDATLVTRL